MNRSGKYLGNGAGKDARERNSLLAGTYEARVTIAGMKCPACATRIRSALMVCSGVYAAEVSLADAEARVVYNPERICSHIIGDAISDAGDNGPYRFSARTIRVTPRTSTRRDRGVQ